MTTITATHKSKRSLKSLHGERRAKPHSVPERIPLSCDESCDGDPVDSYQTADCTTHRGRSGPSASASAAIDHLIGRLSGLNSPTAPLPKRERMLAIVKAVSEHVDASTCPGRPNGYARCVLHEDPAGWSLAAIVMRPGQSTPAHDHGGWGGAVTVQGIERDRRFASYATGELKLLAEGDFPPGTGYLFGPDDVHQPVGADPDEVTVALHFLASAHDERLQNHRERLVVASAVQ
jgi:predicted metal-dependent enzyme (double-stranded beta helix superfamily)